MTARLLLNPAAGRGRGARRRAALEAEARRHGVVALAPGCATALREAVAAAVADGCDRLLVAGGDGTWHQAAQALAGTECALVPIPVGTGNDLARELAMPFEVEAAIAAGLEAPLAPMDLGRVDGRWFLGVAGLGIDSAAAEYSLRVRRLRGPLVYVWSVLATVVRFRPPTATLELDDGARSGRFLLASFANTTCFGGGMRIAPDADRSDGRFDVVTVGEIPLRTFLNVFPRVYRGTHVWHPACRVERSASVRVTAERELPLWADGERLGTAGPGGRTIELVPGALRVPRIPLAV